MEDRRTEKEAQGNRQKDAGRRSEKDRCEGREESRALEQRGESEALDSRKEKQMEGGGLGGLRCPWGRLTPGKTRGTGRGGQRAQGGREEG